jgi:hypothetical protein
MFKKRTNFRKKDVEDDDDDAGDAPGILSAAKGEGGKLKGGTTSGKKSSDGLKLKKGGSSAALLSFEDDEADAEVFQVVKKKAVKKKSMRAPDAALRREGDGAEVEPKPISKGGSEYSLESLRELANSQKSFGARPAEHMDPNAPVELKMRGTLKPPGAEASYARAANLEVRIIFFFKVSVHKKQS